MTPSAPEKRPNRLIDETSPYLRQHAYNPVDWYPWGPEALEAAKRLDRPIFLSIGYSACHWCHVMERECFENEQIARLMNDWFINIKVDREERPDLDRLYMTAVEVMTRHGGWPLSVFLTPDLKPFFGGTYWPPEARMGMPGFRDVLQRVHAAWEQQRDELCRGADELSRLVVRIAQPSFAPGSIDEGLLERAANALLESIDPTWGGFGGAPKFPQPMYLRLLLRCGRRFSHPQARKAVELSLDQMARGGIYDHLGGGFHRYSTDARWLVPHFEKMLYDNALLASTYLEAFQATGNRQHARIVGETLDYVLREMTDSQGGFYSTQDADSEGEEGRFYVWSQAEIAGVLDPDQYRILAACYDIRPEGNWEGRIILHRPRAASEAAAALGLEPDELETTLEPIRRRLFEVRSKRVPPARDEKILVGWNGLMIAAMAQAGRVLAQPRYTDAAVRATRFILETMRREDGTLWHSYKDGRTRYPAFLEDYACLIDALIDVYHATFEETHLQAALELTRITRDRFEDADNGGFFSTSGDHDTPLVRAKDHYDGATPCGNSMMATALIRLAHLCSREDLLESARRTLEAFSEPLRRSPTSGAQALIAADMLIGPMWEFAVIAGEDAPDRDDVVASVFSRFLPNKVVALGTAAQRDRQPIRITEGLLSGKTAPEGQTAVYICRWGACHEPVVGVAALEEALDRLPARPQTGSDPRPSAT